MKKIDLSFQQTYYEDIKITVFYQLAVKFWLKEDDNLNANHS